MKFNLKEIEKRIDQIEQVVSPTPPVEVRFTLSKDEIDESLENVLWVIFNV